MTPFGWVIEKGGFDCEEVAAFKENSSRRRAVVLAPVRLPIGPHIGYEQLEHVVQTQHDFFGSR